MADNTDEQSDSINDITSELIGGMHGALDDRGSYDLSRAPTDVQRTHKPSISSRTSRNSKLASTPDNKEVPVSATASATVSQRTSQKRSTRNSKNALKKMSITSQKSMKSTNERQSMKRQKSDKDLSLSISEPSAKNDTDRASKSIPEKQKKGQQRDQHQLI